MHEHGWVVALIDNLSSYGHTHTLPTSMLNLAFRTEVRVSREESFNEVGLLGYTRSLHVCIDR